VRFQLSHSPMKHKNINIYLPPKVPSGNLVVSLLHIFVPLICADSNSLKNDFFMSSSLMARAHTI